MKTKLKYLRIIGCLLALLVCHISFAQTTKILGRVMDMADGSPLPFVAVFFKDSQVGVSSDTEGSFSLTTRDMNLTELTVQLLGYKPVVLKVKPGAFNEFNVFLRPDDKQLDAVTVKADNRKARRLLANIDKNRLRNNPELRPHYSCDVYSKMELDLTHPREQLRAKAIKKQWSFIFDYIDTSDVSGVPYLPIMINESVTKRYHSSNPDVDREVIVANRMSGAQQESNILAQFTGSMHLKNNFYSQFINAFNVEIPSPINSNGLLFYNYFIIDSLNIDGRKTYMVRYHPKTSISTPAFDGEMFVDAEEYALRSIKAKMVKGQNINWVRDMVLEASYSRCEDSTWFYKSDRFYADFSVTTNDSSKFISFIGNRTLEFSNPVFEKVDFDHNASVSSVKEGAYAKSERYWAQARPYELSGKEKSIYKMVDRVQDTKLYRSLSDVVLMFVNGYIDKGPIGFGHILKFVSFNPLEGFRMRLGIRTSPQFSRRDRFMVYGAFGVKDLMPKGGMTYEHMFRKEPTSKFSFDIHYDALQLGRGTNQFNDGNILASVLGAGKTQKLCMVLDGNVLFEHEFTSGFNASFALGYREFFPTPFVPMIRPKGLALRSVPSAQAALSLRFSKDESVTRGHFVKKYVHSKYPVLTLNLSAGISALNDRTVVGAPALGVKPYPYFIPELKLDWKATIAPIGMTQLNLSAGTIVGKVPYPLLHLHEGNGTYLLDKSSFSTMDFFEFASDSWVTLMWDHNFYGFFLGKIPGIKKLQLREAFTFKASWGHLSKKNNGLKNPDGSAGDALLLFPEGMHTMGKIPYIEMGFGITNILRLFRVDFIWRVTHRNDPRPKPRNFVVNAGLEIKF